MALNWIVPARRLVIASETATYADVLQGWVAELREHRDVLLGWYRGLAPRVDLGAGFDRALGFLEAWVEAFTAGPPEERELAAAPEDEGHFDDVGFWARLWDGPLRVLLQEQAAAEASNVEEEEPQRPDTAPVRSELDHGGPIVVVLDRHQRVALNHDAKFLPGDVLELPLFRLLHLAGVAAFAGAAFDSGGSCFLGTSVVDAQGRSDGTVWLHDNLVAMRFQLLLGAARGAFYSLESSFTDDDQTRKTQPVSLGDRTVHARGIVYGGSLANPYIEGSYRLHDNHWGDKNVPTRETLSQFVGETRLTTGWACSPCALNLLNFMSDHRASWGGGSVNRHGRGTAESGTWARALVEYDHFHHTFAQCGGAAALADHAQRLRLGGDEATSENVRAFALARLFGRELPPLVSSDHGHDGGDDDDGGPEPPAFLRSAPPPDALLAQETSAAEDNPDPDLDPDDDSLEAHVHAPRLDVGALLPGNEEVSRSKAELLEYLGEAAFAAVGLNGHEYSWVVVHAPRALLDEPVQSIVGQEGRPPQTGPISAYDPLSGEPQATGEGPEVFIFEATGSFHPYRLQRVREDEEGFGYTVFEVRPFRWSKVSRVLLRRSTRMRTYGSGAERRRVEEETSLGIGEDATFTRRAQIRAKPLLSISRVPLEHLSAKHRETRTFLPLYLHTVRGRRARAEHAAAGYASRAVPFATLAESSADTRFSTLDAAQDTIDGHRVHLRRHLSELRALERRVDRLSAEDITFLEARIPGGATFPRLVARKEGELRSTHDAEVRQLGIEVASLRRRLASHCPPDPGQSTEQLLHERASYRALLTTRLVAAERETRAERAARTREEGWQGRARSYEEKRAALESVHDSTDAEWTRAARIAVIREWSNHVREMLRRLT